MPIFSYDEYINLIPANTRNFIIRFIDDLKYILSIKVNNENVIYNDQKALIIALYSYYHSSDLGKNTLKLLGVDLKKVKVTKIQNVSISTNNIFGDYYNIFVPLKNEEEYLSLTPEDIIKELFKKCYNDIIIDELISLDYNKIDNIINELSNNKKEEINKTLNEKFNANLDPNLISYYNEVGKVFNYLRNNKNNIKNYDINDNSLITLSLILGIYLYENNKNNDKTTLLEYFNSIGFKLDILENKLNINIQNIDNDFNTTQILYKYFNSSFLKSDIHNINDLFIKISTEKSEFNLKSFNLYLNKILYLCNISSKELIDVKKNLKEKPNKKESERKNELENKLLYDINIDVYSFLKVLSNYYTIISTTDLNDEDKEQLSIILAASRYNDDIRKYLESFNLTRSNIVKSFNIDIDYHKSEFDIDIINDHFKKYIFDRDIKDISVYSIFENAFNDKLINSLNLREILFKYNSKIDDFINIEEKINSYKKKKENEKYEAKIKGLFYNIDEKNYDIIESSLKIYEYLNSKNINNVCDISILLSILNSNSDYNIYFKNNKIDLNSVLEYIGISINDFNNILTSDYKKENILNFKKYLSKDELRKSNIDDFIKVLLNNKDLFNDILAKSNIEYDTFVDEVINKKEKELSISESISLLENEKVLPVNTNNFSNLSEYGLNLTKHSKAINNSLHKLIFNDIVSSSIESINDSINDVFYEEVVENDIGLFKYLFTLEEKTKIIKKINIDKLNELEDNVNEKITNLNNELKGYETIKKYIELYLFKLEKYEKYLEEKINEFNNNFDEINNINDIKSYTMLLNQKSYKEILNNKLSTFKTMSLLMKQELLSVHSAIINHFITINALQTSKNAILPLIQSEVNISKGNESEKDALELTSNLMNLFQSMVNKNIIDSKENLNRLKLTNISNDTYETINRQINSYIDTVNKSEKLLEDEDNNLKLIK